MECYTKINHTAEKMAEKFESDGNNVKRDDSFAEDRDEGSKDVGSSCGSPNLDDDRIDKIEENISCRRPCAVVDDRNNENKDGSYSCSSPNNDRNDKDESNIICDSPNTVPDNGIDGESNIRVENPSIVTENDDSPNDLHTFKLGKICRICGEMTVKHKGPKRGIPKREVERHVKKIWNVDISGECSDIYPVNVCISCQRRIKRIYTKISKKRKCELFREKPAEFVEHVDEDCAVCQLEEKPCTPLPSTDQQEGYGSEGKNVSISLPTPEPRRNSSRKRCCEEEEAFKTVSSQTDENIGLDNTTGLEEHDYTEDKLRKHYLAIPKKHGGRMRYNKQSLSTVNAKYIRRERLKPLIAHIDQFCEIHKEDKTDVLFFLLVQALRDIGDRSRESVVEDIWCKRGSVGNTLSQEECLAKRVLLKQTKEQYRKEYSYYKEKLDVCVLKPPFMLDRLEKTYFPEHLEYYVMYQGDNVIYHHPLTTSPSYVAVTQNEGGREEGQGWKELGVRWHFMDALAKTLEELWGTLGIEEEEDESMYLQADVNDYWEERRDTTFITDKSDQTGRTAPKIITYMFRVQSLLSVTHDKTTSIYKADPNVNMYRPLMKAIVGEGGTLQPTLSAIEAERAEMIDKVLHISVSPNKTLKVIVRFSSSVAEMRKDYRNVSGLNLWSLRRGPAVVNRYGSMCLDLKRGWLATSPRLVSVSTIMSSRTKCSRCGHQGHNVRRCSLKCDAAESKGQHWKRMKKQRSVPTTSHPPISSLSTQVPLHDVKMGGCARPTTNEPVLHLPSSCVVPTVSATHDSSPVVSTEVLWSRTNTSSESFTNLSAAPCQTLTTSTSCVQAPVQPQVATGHSVNEGSHNGQNPSAPVYVWTTYTVMPPTPQTPHTQNLVSHQPLTPTVEPHQTQSLPQLSRMKPRQAPLSHITHSLKTEHQNPPLPHLSAQSHSFSPSSQQQQPSLHHPVHSVPSQTHPEPLVIHEPSHQHLPEPPDHLSYSSQSSSHQLSVIQHQMGSQWPQSHIIEQPVGVTLNSSQSLTEQHSGSQSVSHQTHLPSSQSISHPSSQSVSHQTHLPSSQSISHPISQSISHPSSQSISHPSSQSVSHQTHLPSSQSISHPNSQSISHPSSQSISHQTHLPSSQSIIHHPSSQSVNPSSSQSISHPSSQSISHHPSSQSVNPSSCQGQDSSLVIQKFPQPQQPVIILQQPATSEPSGDLQQLTSQHHSTIQ